MWSKHRAYLMLSVFDGAPLHDDSTQSFCRVVVYFWFSYARCSTQDQDRGMHIMLLIHLLMLSPRGHPRHMWGI